MTECTEPFAEQYLEGRRCGRNGAHRDTNPFFRDPRTKLVFPNPRKSGDPSTTFGFALRQLGFRPVFLLASLFGALSVGLWAAQSD